MAVERKASHPESKTDSIGVRILQSVNVERFLIAYFVAGAIYIYLPILSVLVFSFNLGGITPPFTGFTTQWYSDLFASGGMIAAIRRSLQLAVVVTVITTVMATTTALAYRYDFWGQRQLLYLIILGIITPGITYSVGAVLFLSETLGFARNLWLAVPVHVVWTLPFAFIVLLAGFPPNLSQNEQAARVMGASNITTFRKIILPQIAPTVLGAAVFAFTLSYNEAERGLLLVGQETTMPLEVFAIASSQRATPDLFALGGVTTVLSTGLLVFAGYLVILNVRRTS